MARANPRRLKTEDPIRLRECLDALSEACGHDVFRCEVVSTKLGIRILVTSSRQNTEPEVAKLIAEHLAPYLGASGTNETEAPGA